MIPNGTRVRIKKFDKEKPIMWDEIFEGKEGVIDGNNGEGCQYHVVFDKPLKYNRPDWGFGKFWESEFEIIGG